MTDQVSLAHGLKLAHGFEEMLKHQTGMVVQLAIKATTTDMGNDEMARLLWDQINALTFARASGMLFIALAKKEIGELEFSPEVLQEMKELEEQRIRLIKELNKE